VFLCSSWENNWTKAEKEGCKSDKRKEGQPKKEGGKEEKEARWRG